MQEIAEYLTLDQLYQNVSANTTHAVIVAKSVAHYSTRSHGKQEPMIMEQFVRVTTVSFNFSLNSIYI